MADAREHVVERAIGRFREAHAVGGDDRQVERRGEVAERVIVGFLVAQEMALQLDADVLRAERADQAIDETADAVARAVDRRAPGEGDEAADAVEIVEGQRAFAFGAASFIRVTSRQRLR